MRVRVLTKTKSNRLIIISAQILLLTLLGFVLVRSIPAARAADTNLTNGITVDSILDTADASVGNGTCDDGSGNCTLRAAIEEANSNADTSTIQFNISGAGVHTIELTSELPQVTERVAINGYSQPGSQANTAAAPDPLNGTLLIEIDGNNVSNNPGFAFAGASNNSTIKGLVINSFTSGDAILLLADNVEVQGNYIGTNAAGAAAKPNMVGVNAYVQSPESGHNALIGGLDAEDRNLISGNTAGVGGATASYPGNGWVFQGNYMGVAADGLTPITNSTVGGSGTLSIDVVDGVIVGGAQPTAINVIGASLGHGLAPHEATNLQIEGNYVGLGYDGSTVLGNVGGGDGAGITTGASVDYVIKNNKIAGWTNTGIFLGQDNAQGSVEGNETIGNAKGIIADGAASTVITGNQISDTTDGIYVWNSEDITVQNNTIENTQHGIGVGANSTATIIDTNIVSDSSTYGIGASGATITGLEITNNEVDLSQDGVWIIGAIDALIDGNVISANTDDGIDLGGATGTLQVVGNEVYSNDDDGIAVGATSGLFVQDNTIYSNAGFGIHATNAGARFAAVTNSIYDNDEMGISLGGNTPLDNDSLDPDSGANDLLNVPEYSNVQEASGNTTVDYYLDVPAGNYRIEFYSNTTADPTGSGEGEAYLGFQNVTSAGSGKQAISYVLTGVTGVTNLALTATERDNSADGFRITSEFGGEADPVTDISVSKVLTNPQDIAGGALANYEINYTNNGPNDADLSGFGNVGAGMALLYDFVPADLINPAGYLADGPFPGSYVFDAGNPDLTCLYGPAPTASLFNLTNDTTIGFVACWLTGVDTTLESGESITLTIEFEVEESSDLTFTNYTLGNAPSTDPDISVMNDAIASGDTLGYYIAMDSPVNNFAAAEYPVPSEPDGGGSSDGGQSNSNGQGILAGTGSSTLIIVGFASLLLLSAGTILSKRAQ